MTAQFSDIVFFREEEYALTDLQGDDLFHPSQYDMHPDSTCTACWKGFVASYAVKQDKLILKNLDINLEKSRKKYFWSSDNPEINDKKPSDGEALYGLFDYHFQDVDLPLSYTGWMLIGEGFIQKLYVHMGTHPAWKYKKVYKLEFEKGELVASHDVSKAMAGYRKKFKDNGEEPGKFSGGHEPDVWIDNYLRNL